MLDIKNLPQPYFLINTDFDILAFSECSRELFNLPSNLLELVDWDSKEKAISLFSNQRAKMEGELIMKTKVSPYALIDVSINWVDSHGYVLCLEKDHRLEELENLVEKHRLRLSSTNMELLEKKEEIETSLKEIKRLSFPFIKLTFNAALIPIYGNIESDLIKVNSSRLLKTVNQGDYDQVFFDFNGVGYLTIEGVEAFKELVSELQLMGISPAIIGVKPDHAFFLHQVPLLNGLSFYNRLDKVIKTIN